MIWFALVILVITILIFAGLTVAFIIGCYCGIAMEHITAQQEQEKRISKLFNGIEPEIKGKVN